MRMVILMAGFHLMSSDYAVISNTNYTILIQEIYVCCSFIYLNIGYSILILPLLSPFYLIYFCYYMPLPPSAETYDNFVFFFLLKDVLQWTLFFRSSIQFNYKYKDGSTLINFVGYFLRYFMQNTCHPWVDETCLLCQVSKKIENHIVFPVWVI